MAGTENNAAIAAALGKEESRKWNPFIKRNKGFNAQNDLIQYWERRLNNPSYLNRLPLLKSLLKNPYEAGKFCKKFGYYGDCKELKAQISYKRNTTNRRSLYDVQTDAWKADYDRGFTGAEETTAKNGKNFKSKYGRTRSNRKRGTRKRV